MERSETTKKSGSPAHVLSAVARMTQSAVLNTSSTSHMDCSKLMNSGFVSNAAMFLRHKKVVVPVKVRNLKIMTQLWKRTQY